LVSFRYYSEAEVKINVIGTSGSGKSTLAKQIATELAIPYIEMDRLYWRPDWQGTPDDVSGKAGAGATGFARLGA
jgi:adenylate kinase family enzyme